MSSDRNPDEHPDNNDSLDLEAIKPPAEVPSETPDQGAKEEKLAHQRAHDIAALTPTERHTFAVQRMLIHLESENDQLKDNYERRGNELANLRERYAALAQAKKDVSITSVLATIAMALGGGILSFGAFCEENLKWPLAATGVTLLLVGCFFSVVIQAFGWPSNTHR